MSATIVVTGGNGFVGRHLVRELAEHEPATAAAVWDRPSVDITQPDTYRAHLKKLQPTWIVHLAALANVADSWRDPAATARVNVEATEALLASVAADSPRTKVLVVSSADIYGLPERSGEPYDLRTPLPELPLSHARPRSPYGQSKLAMEQVIEAKYAQRCLRVRPFPHIGPGQRLGFVTADFASQVAAIEAGNQPPVVHVGNLAAERDFTDVRDVVRAYRLLMAHGVLGEVYHVASGRVVSIKDLLEQLLTLSTASITVAVDAKRLRPVDIPRLVGDATKLTTRTGWQPEIPLTTSLVDILEYWREQAGA